MNSQAEPRYVFVPLAYATLIVAPAERPYSALMLLVTTLNSPTASGRRLHHLVRKALVAGAVGVVVDAIDQEVIEGRAQAIDVERAFARREAAGVQRGQADARRQQRQRRVFAAVEGQGLGLFAGNDLAAIARIGLQQHGARTDFNLFRQLADRHVEVDALARANGYLDVVDQRNREAVLLGRNHIRAGTNGEEFITTVGVAGFLIGHAGLGIGQRHLGARHHGARRILEGADDRAGLELGKGRRGEQRNRE